VGLLSLAFSACFLIEPRTTRPGSTIPTEMDFVVVLGFKAGALFISVRFFLGLSAAQRKFAHSLRDFKFEFIGDAETDDERCIDASLREFSNFLKNLEEQREIMVILGQGSGPQAVFFHL
uniref:BAR domain-containing protein n=1 Tax=Peromyscus maniculatus bairdii TaxID=230844 RepID=A0A8C8UN67_PERMB